jgi:hypothetical protein
LILVKFRKERWLCANQRLACLLGNRLVGFQAAIAANVKHGVASLGQYAANQQAAMAVGRIFLAANQRHAESLHACFKTRDPRLKVGVVSDSAIKHVAFGVVVSGIGWPSAQLSAQKKVAYPRTLQ